MYTFIRIDEILLDGMMIATLFSGGKDSTLALHMASEIGFESDLLVTVQPENADSYMFHRANIRFSHLQAESMRIRQIMIETKGEKEKELGDIEESLRSNDISVLITGAVASNYQRSRINEMCEQLNIRHISPLWGIDPLKELEILSKDYDVIITKVAAEGLDNTYLGRHINEDMIDKLLYLNKKYKINMLFDGGEAETFVLNAPKFSKKIVIDKQKIDEERDGGMLIIKEAHLKEI